MEQELHVWNVTEQLLQNRVVKIYGEIDTRIVHEATSLLDVLSNDDPTAVIKIELATPGGSVLDGLGLCDKIREIPNPVICFCTGYSASMGTAISSCCDYVYGSETASFMIHEMSTGLQGKFRELKNQMKFDEELNHRLMEIIAKKCKKTVDQVMKDAVYDHWMNSKEALEYGLIDAITPHPKKDLTAMNEFIKNYK